MADIQNERDLFLQSEHPRFILPIFDPSQIPGYEDALQDIEDLQDSVGHLMNTSSSFAISASAMTFTRASGTTTPSTITLTARRGDGLVGGTVAWTVFAGSATISPTTGNTCTVTGSTVTGSSVTIRARLTISGQTHDAYVTLTRLGAIAATDQVNLSNQVTGQLANGNVSGLGALALLNTIDLNTQTTGALNGLTQVNNLGTLAYANAIAANQIGAGTLAAGVIYSGTIEASKITAGTLQSGVIYSGTIAANRITSGTLASGVIYSGTVNADQVNSGSFAGKTFTGAVFTGGEFRTSATGRRVVLHGSQNALFFYPPSGDPAAISASSATGEGILIYSPPGARHTTVKKDGGGPALVLLSEGHGLQTLTTGPDIIMFARSTLPATRTTGSICFYNNWLCFAANNHWYQSDGTQLT